MGQHNPSVIYKFCSDAFFQSLAELHPEQSQERAVILGMSKIIHAFYYMYCKEVGVKTQLMDPHIFMKYKFANDIKGYFRSRRAFANNTRSKGEILVLGQPSIEARWYAEKRQLSLLPYVYPGKVFWRSSLRGVKRTNYQKFFNHMVDRLMPLDLDLYKKLQLVADTAAHLASQLESYALKCSEEIQKLGFEDALITKSGNWRNRVVGSLCSYLGINTIGVPHGNIFLTSFDEDLHIENDVLPICNIVLVYNDDHLKDWEQLCKVNRRIKLNPKFEIISDNISYQASRSPVKRDGVKILFSGHIYNNDHHVFLKNYTTASAMALEQKMINELHNVTNGSQIDYKPHPDNRQPAFFNNCNLLDGSQKLEDIIQNYDLIVFPHPKSSTFGFCMQNHTSLLVFLDHDISISERSLLKLKSLCHTVNLNFEDSEFVFDQFDLKRVFN